jgi:hypothetical protein
MGNDQMPVVHSEVAATADHHIGVGSNLAAKTCRLLR